MADQKNEPPTPQETALAVAQERGNVKPIVLPSRSMDHFTDEQKQVIKNTICRKSTDTELAFFLSVCERMKLDPFRREIYPVKRWNQDTGQMEMAIQIGIDGLRSQAADSNLYVGQNGPWWCGKDGVWKDVWLFDDPPYAAKVEVLNKAFQTPMVAIAKYSSYVQRNKQGAPVKVWKEMPELMLAKCAEALAIRKAFPHKTAGLYIPEEMAAAEFSFINTTSEEMEPEQIEQRNNAHRVEQATKALPSAKLTMPEEAQQKVREAGEALGLKQQVINERLDDLEVAFREDEDLLQPALDGLLSEWREQWKQAENKRIAEKKNRQLAGAPKPPEDGEPPAKPATPAPDPAMVAQEHPWMSKVKGAKVGEVGRAVEETESLSGENATTPEDINAWIEAANS